MDKPQVAEPAGPDGLVADNRNALIVTRQKAEAIDAASLELFLDLHINIVSLPIIVQAWRL